MIIKKALTIAGSDSSGGAGVQADLKTFAALGVYGTSVITAVTAQNTVGVQGVYDLPSEFIALQLDSILADIGADAVKTGVLPNSQIIEVVCEKIKAYHLSKLVVDPVMISTSGHRFISAEAVRILIEKLIPFAYLVTPNLNEAEMIAEIKIETTRDMELAAQKIRDKGAANVVVKGGHLSGDAIDVLFDGRTFFYYGSERLQTKNTHGTGCTFSAAITAELAKGNDLQSAVKIAKDYITNAIRYSYDIGSGRGPVNHFQTFAKSVS
jgi:hydroxymethylpyrimidine/phosphomethylpyrimidine kinase